MADNITKEGNTIPDSSLVEEQKEARIYEVGYLVVPSVSEVELPREVTALKDVLDTEKAAIIAEEFPKLRQLAYSMQKRTGGEYHTYPNAYFGWVKFEVSVGSAQKIEQAFKQNEKILRFILVKTVREQTVTLGRPRVTRPGKKEAPKDAPASAPVSETELDKSIEKLIAE